MKRILSYIIISLIIIQILAPFGMLQSTFAMSQSYDFSNPSDYTISNTDEAYIHGGAAKLKWELQRRSELENGPSVLDSATNVIYEGNIAYVAASWGNAISSFDVSDPTNIKPLWYLGADSTNRLYNVYDLQKSGNYLYVVSLSSDSMQVIDVSDPSDLRYVTRVWNNTNRKLDGARGIDIVWDFAYIAAYNDDALQIIDISNPTSPVAKGFVQNNTRLNGAIGVEVAWDFAYVTGYLWDTVNAIDISDPDNPTIVASIWDDAITELNGAWGIEIQGNYAYVAGHIDDGLEIIDISDPTNLTHVGEIQNTDPGVFLNGARELKIQWSLAYITASSDDSLEIVDISNPANPTHVGVLDTSSFGELDGIFGIDISWNTVLVTSNANSSMYSIDVSNPNNPNFIGRIFSWPARLGTPNGILIDGNYAYVANYRWHGLSIFDVSNSSNITPVSFVGDVSTQNELFWAWDIEKKWDYLYVSSLSDSGLEVIDVSNPSNPISVTRFLDNSNTIELHWARGSDIQWDFLYVVWYNGDSLQIFDISNPANPIVRWNIVDNTLLNTANDVQVVWNYAYITTYLRDAVAVVDISDPNNPIFIRELRDTTWLELNGSWDLDVSHDEQYLYVVTLVDDAIVTLDISTPGDPQYTGDLDDDGTTRLNWGRWIVYDEWYAYLGVYNDDSIAVVDVSDPTTPLYIDEMHDTTLYDTTAKITKKDNDIFAVQYLGSSLSVIREVYPDTHPFIIPKTPTLSNGLQSMSVTLWEFNEWRIHFQLSKDNETTWYYHNGTSWQTTTGGISEANNIVEINAALNDFNTLPGTGEIVWKVFMESKGAEKVEIDEIILSPLDTTPPTVSSSFPLEWSLIPKHNFDIRFDYFDSDGPDTNPGVGVDTSTGTTDFATNIAPNASITATPATVWWVPPHPDSIVNGIISTSGAFDYEYHSNTANAFIEFRWDTPQKIGDMKIYNRVWCCSERLSNATIKLYNDTGGLLYTHTLWNTTGIDIIDIDFEWLSEIHNVSTLRLDSVWPNSFINIREIEIFPIKENIELRKWDGIAFWENIAHEYIDFSQSSFWTGSAIYPTFNIPFGRYEMDFEISDLNGNTTSTWVIFYIDEPSFSISTWTIDIGTISPLGTSFSDQFSITVETVGAPFDIFINTPTPSLWNAGEIISAWNGIIWFWYEGVPLSNSLLTIGVNEVINSQNGTINTNGEKNSYTIDLRLGALIEEYQAWWDYEWKIDIGVNFMY